MKCLVGSLIGLVLSVSVGAEPLLKGQVRLSSGQPAVGVQVRLFDLTDLRRFVGTTTDETGHFALPLRALSMERGTALPTGFGPGTELPQSVQSLYHHPPINCRCLATCVWKCSICWDSVWRR